MDKTSYVYIIGNNLPTLYIGVTTDLGRRLHEHQQGTQTGFASKYKLTKLLYFETYPDIESAIAREKQLKNWHRDWKLNLIRGLNPKLKDLSSDFHF